MRKSVLLADDDQAVQPAEAPVDTTRPLLGRVAPRQTPAMGALQKSLGGLSADNKKQIDDLERQLAAGQTIVELEPSIIDGSFVVDRMASSSEDHEAFVAAIREHGQQVPILVRPKPDVKGRYEVAYGHRRLRAAQQLGRPVRAVVRDLTDAELVVAQGQENSARQDLTFIERARFAARLEDRKFSRETIMSALNVDKAALSKLIAVASRIPQDLIEAIGPAPGYGRQRWQELVEAVEDAGAQGRARKCINGAGFADLDSPMRFEAILQAVRAPVARSRPEAWTAEDGSRVVKIMRGGKRLTLAFDQRVNRDFGEFVTGKLGELYAEYLTNTGDER